VCYSAPESGADESLAGALGGQTPVGEFLTALFAFPTVIFTVLLALVLVYWVLAVLGALDIEMLDIQVGGDAEVGGDVLDGLDAAAGPEAPAETGGALGGLLVSLGLAGVPITVALSLLVLWAWLLAFFATDLLLRNATDPVLRGWLAILVIVLSLALSVALSALSIRPLQRFFVTTSARSRGSLVGKVCVVTTLRVDARFGQARLEDDGADLLLPVRCRRPNQLGKGARALIIGYDSTNNVYDIVPHDDAEAEALLQ